MIFVTKETNNDIPMLHVVAKDNEERRVPLVIFYHGYTGEKEFDLHYAYRLAEIGYRVILPDALYHGERRGNLSFQQRELMFWEIVINSIHELEKIVNTFVTKGLANLNRVAVGGVSMGAITALGAAKHYKWLNVVASLMGTPSYVEFASLQIETLNSQQRNIFNEQEASEKLLLLEQYDLLKNIDVTRGKKLFLWHGKQDTVVPIDGVEKLAKQLTNKEDVTVYVDQNAGHSVTKEAMDHFYHWMKDKLK